MSTRALAAHLAGIRYEDLPAAARNAVKSLLIDWVACALAGKDAEPVRLLESFARRMGPAGGPSQILVSRRRTSPLFAALVNAASSHVVEQDDLHNAAILHPGTVVFPAALAAAQDVGARGEVFLGAAVAGYEAAARVGEYLGPAHYRVFHTTATAGTLGAAAAAAAVLGAGSETMLNALGSAGTQAAGLWAFLRDGAHSKQLHTAKAAADGLLAAYLARDGFTGARCILEDAQGMAAGMSSSPDPHKLLEGLGSRWAVCETSVKFHACCRHTHPAADALAHIIGEHALDYRAIDDIRVGVYRAARDVLGAVGRPQSVHQAKFSMGFVLALIAREGRAGIEEFTEQSIRDEELLALAGKVRMVPDAGIDGAYPARWMAAVEVRTADGRTFSHTTRTPKGDPDNPLSAAELRDKALRLATFRGGASAAEMGGLIERLRRIDGEASIGDLLA